ncbi:MAG: 3-methyladenine DNA glycosylase [Chloroflexota bacterium]
MITITIPVPPGFSFKATVESHGWPQLAPFRYEDNILHYTYRLSTGRTTTLTFTDGIHIEADISLTGEEQTEVIHATKRIFGTQLDLTEFYALTHDIPRLAWVEQIGAGRLLAAPTVWEDMVKTLLTTNVSWTNTVNMVARLCDYGDTATDGSHAFPTPQQIALQDPEALNAHVRAGYRMKSLHGLAIAIASGELNTEAWRDSDLPAEARYAEIIKQHGFGAYAAGSMMRLLGHHEWLALDSVAKAAFATLHNKGKKPTNAQIEEFYAPYGKWRGLVIWMDILMS